MSVQEVRAFQIMLLDWIKNPRAWVLRANPVWGSAETMNNIALFDTREQAEEYVKRSRLPEDLTGDQRKTKDGYYRSFRPDSLLWDYNGLSSYDINIQPMIPWYRYDNVVENPIPPSGLPPNIVAISELDPERIETGHARYGKDFDVGCGGPYSNMDGERPRKPL